jgi:MFS family permease
LSNPDRKDTLLLFSTRIIRLFCYGFLSVVLALYLIQAGLTEEMVGLLFTLTLAGDAGISLWLTTSADRFGRKRTLIVGALLMVGAGVVFIFTQNPITLAVAAIIGVISPSGNEIGPFLSVEQAALTHVLPGEKRTETFAWYALAGSLATATGALSGGWLAQGLQQNGFSAFNAYRIVLAGYALGGLILIGLFLSLSKSVEILSADHIPQKLFLGLHRSKSVVMRLSGLFALDAFAGALLVQSLLAYWFHLKYGVDTGVLGSIFFGANILAGLSALFAARIAKRFGLINTMVFTHVPSNILLILVPLMPNLPLAIGMLLARFSISQMDVPSRQSYTMAVVAPDERSAASGVTTIARSVGAAISPSLAGWLLSVPFLFSAPFFLAGGLKLVYDLLLYKSFRAIKPPEETGSR